MKGIKELNIWSSPAENAPAYFLQKQKAREDILAAFQEENKNLWKQIRRLKIEGVSFDLLFFDENESLREYLTFYKIVGNNKHEIKVRNLLTQQETDILKTTKIAFLISHQVFLVSQSMAERLLKNVKGLSHLPQNEKEFRMYERGLHTKLSNIGQITYLSGSNQSDNTTSSIRGTILSFFNRERYKAFLYHYGKAVKQAVLFFEDNQNLMEMGYDCKKEDICSIEYQVDENYAICRIFLNNIARVCKAKYSLPDLFIPVIEFKLESVTGRLYINLLMSERKKKIELQFDEISRYVNTNKEFNYIDLFVETSELVQKTEKFFLMMKEFLSVNITDEEYVSFHEKQIRKGIAAQEEFDGSLKGHISFNREAFKKHLGKCLAHNGITEVIHVDNKKYVVDTSASVMKSHYIFTKYDVYCAMLSSFNLLKEADRLKDVQETTVRSILGNFVFPKDDKSKIQELFIYKKEMEEEDFYALYSCILQEDDSDDS